MQRIKLYNGYEIPVMGYGTYPQKDSLEITISQAASCGCELIDTSDNYHNEEYVGIGLKKQEQKEFVILSKFSEPLKSGELEDCYSESQTKIGRPVDVYLLHWPYPFLWKMQWRKMEALYKSGKCKAIGVCNFETKHLKKLLRFCRVKPMINQFEHHPFFQQEDTVRFCREHSIQVMSYTPLGRFDDDLMHSDVLKKLAQKYGKSVGQIILRWNIDSGCIPIPGASSQSHISENFDVFDFALTQEEIAEINGLECGRRMRFDPDKRFTLKMKLLFLRYRLRAGKDKTVMS